MKSILSETNLNLFVQKMVALCKSRGADFSSGHQFFKGLDIHIPRTLQLYYFSTPSGVAKFLFIKGSYIDKGWWGPSIQWLSRLEKFVQTLARFLNERGTSDMHLKWDWGVILLRGSEKGFLLHSKEFNDLIPRLSTGPRQIHITESQLDPKFEF